MSDTVVQFGPVSLKGFEVPDKLPFGGTNALAVKRLPGGVKIADNTGFFQDDISWEGRFRGSDALARAQAMEALFQSGTAITLIWSGLSFLVVPKTFRAEFERFYEIPYTVTVEVLADQTANSTPGATPGLDDQMADDLSTATDLSTSIDDPALTSAMGSLSSAMGAVPTLIGASQSTINDILAPIASVQSRVQALIGETAALVPDSLPIGGVVSAQRGDLSAEALMEQVTAATSLPDLYNLASVASRMTANLDADGVSGTTIVTAQDLYHVAASAYGDPSGWTDIAAANGLSDPVLVGVQSIRIPPVLSGSGGVLAAP